MAERPVVASVDLILFAALAMLGAVLVRWEITGMIGDGVAFLGTATALVGVWIGARVDRRGQRRDDERRRDSH